MNPILLITYHNVGWYHLIGCSGLALVQLGHVRVLVNASEALLTAVSHNLVRKRADRISKVFGDLVLNVLVFFELHLLLGLLSQCGLYSKQETR